MMPEPFYFFFIQCFVSCHIYAVTGRSQLETCLACPGPHRVQHQIAALVQQSNNKQCLVPRHRLIPFYLCTDKERTRIFSVMQTTVAIETQLIKGDSFSLFFRFVSKLFTSGFDQNCTEKDNERANGVFAVKGWITVGEVTQFLFNHWRKKKFTGILLICS